MKLNIRYKKETEDPVNAEIELHKNVKGYNINIEGKYYFPSSDNPVIKDLKKFENKELWVVIKEDKINYGNIAFAVPDYFIVPEENNKGIRIEKEIPLNKLDNIDEPFVWDYVTISKCHSIDDTDKMIDELEAEGCSKDFIKMALDEFYLLK